MSHWRFSLAGINIATRVAISALISFSTYTAAAQDLALRDSFFRKLTQENNKSLFVTVDQGSVVRLDGPEVAEDTFELLVTLRNEWPENSRSYDAKSVILKRVELGRFKHNKYPHSAPIDINAKTSIPVEQIRNVIDADFANYRHTTFEICTVVKSLGKYAGDPVAEQCTNLASILQQSRLDFEAGSKQPNGLHIRNFFEKTAHYAIHGCVGLGSGNSNPCAPTSSTSHSQNQAQDHE